MKAKGSLQKTNILLITYQYCGDTNIAQSNRVLSHSAFSADVEHSDICWGNGNPAIKSNLDSFTLLRTWQKKKAIPVETIVYYGWTSWAYAESQVFFG